MTGIPIQLRSDAVYHFLGFLILLGILVISYQSLFPQISQKMRNILIGLRGSALFFLLLVLWDPRYTYQTQLLEKQPLVLMVDASQSMALEGTVSGLSRAEQVQQLFQKEESLLTQLQERFAFFRTGFHGELTSDETPLGKRTDIYGCLNSLETRYPGKKLDVILVSDGAHHFASGSAPLQTRVHTVRVCPSERHQTLDFIAYRFLLPTRFFVGQPFQGKLVITENATADSVPLEVLLRFGTEEKRLKTVYNGQYLTLPFEFSPQKEGECLLQAEILPVLGETHLENNRLEKTIRVQKEGIAVLFLEKSFRPEQKWISRTLAQMPSVQLDLQFLEQNSSPEMLRYLQKYKVILLGELLLKEEAPFLQYLEKGGGIWLLAHPSLNIKNSPLWIQACPVQFGPLQWSQLPASLQLNPSSPLFSFLSCEESQLLPLPRFLQMGALKNGSMSVLTISEKKFPLLTLTNSGLGRVALLATDTFYHLRYNDSAEEQFQKNRLFYEQTLRQTLLWLANQKEEEIQVELEKTRFFVGEPILAKVLNAKEQCVFRGTLFHQDSSTEIMASFQKKDDFFETSWTPTLAGNYRLKVEGELSGRSFFAKEIPLSLYERDYEKQTLPNAELLQTLSLQTQGKSVSIEDASTFLKQILSEYVPIQVIRTHEKRIWDNSFLFILFFLCLICEWILRKKFRLI